MIKKPSRTDVLNILRDNLLWIIGMSFYSVGLNCFAVPNNIAQSGVSGLAIVGHHLFPAISLGTFNFLINLPLLVLALIFIGKKFVGKTLWVTVILSVLLDVWGRVIPVYRGDKILAACFAGIFCGIGLALVLMTGATSGGTDIVSRLIHKAFPHISIGRVLLVADGIVVIVSAIAFRSIESAMYAVILIFISTKVVDAVLYGMGNGKMLVVITSKGREISEAVTGRTRRGVTILQAEGAYTGEGRQVLLCVMRSGEVQKIRKIINEIDPSTFIIVTEASEILGKGFRNAI